MFVVGAGGNVLESSGNPTPAGTPGNDSTFNSLTALKGGGGGGWATGSGGNGGSGGGARIGDPGSEGSGSGASHPGAADATTPSPIATAGGWGYPGGTYSPGPYYGSGGGGATAQGGAGGSDPSGAGGNGAAYTILGSSYTWAGGEEVEAKLVELPVLVALVVEVVVE